MRSLESLGAAGGEVMGSAFVFTTDKGTRILIDCGKYPGYDKRNFSLNIAPVDGVLVTHGHTDHIGRLPLVPLKKGASTYMTPPTYDVTRIALNNSQVLSPSMYPPGSVKLAYKNIIQIPYDRPFSLDGVTIKFRDAGHIIGSSIIEMQEKGGEKVVISGDLGNFGDQNYTPFRTVRPPTFINNADIVLIESTYGDRLHPKEDPTYAIIDGIERIKTNNGTLLIPAFAIDRTQIILNILKRISETGKLNGVRVFLDCKMAAEITRVYTKYSKLLNDELKSQIDPFNLPELTIIRSRRQSKEIIEYNGPKLIIAGSGMMSGGRIVPHSLNYLHDKNSAILFVGHPAKGTPSNLIVNGEKEVLFDKKLVNIKAAIYQTTDLSAHADRDQLFGWAKEIKGVKSYIVVHGEDPSREGLEPLLKDLPGVKNVFLPKEGETTIFHPGPNIQN